MKKSKFALLSSLAMLSCGILTSCDYSDFSLFGFFYNRWEAGYEEELKKPGSNSSSASDSTSSSTSDDSTVFATQTYLNTLEEKTLDDGAKIQGYQLLTILSAQKAMLVSYQKYVPTTGSSHTYTSYQTVANYTRNDNIINFSMGPSVYVNREDTLNIGYHPGSNETTSKEAFKLAFGSETASFLLKEDGSFQLGTETSGNLAKGLSTANTYFDYDESSRPTYKVLTLLDNNEYYLNSLAMNSKNPDEPTSSFVTKGTYQKVAEKATEEYEVVHINLGRGHMYASNNGSDMEFDIPDDDSFSQWVGMCIGQIHSYRVTKVGFEGTLGSINPYGFEMMSEEAADDQKTEDADPLEKATLVLEGKKNKDIRLGFFADKTYHFVWTANNIDEQGTYSYDSETGKVILTTSDGDKTKTNEIVKNEEDDNYSITYVSILNDALNQSFDVTASDFKKYFAATSILKLDGDKKAEIGLEFYSDGSYVFAYTGTPAKDEGTWTYDSASDVVTLKVGDKTCGTSKYSNGLYVISYTYSQSEQLTQNYTLSKKAFGKVFVHALVTLRGEERDTASLLSINSDGTTNIAMTPTGSPTSYNIPGTYNIKEDGSVEILSSTGTLAATSAKQEDGSYLFSYSAGYTQNYKMDAETFKSVFSVSDCKVKGVVAPEKTYLSLNHDHTYTFAYAFSGEWQEENGGWTYDEENDKFVLTLGLTVNELTKQEDGTYKGTYLAHVDSRLSQAFVINDTSFLPKVVSNIDKTNASQTHFGFIFYSDHSYAFHFYNYNVTEKGTWSYDSTTEKFFFRCNRTTLEASKNESGDYVFNYISYKSSQMTQEFTLTAAEASKVIQAN